ncbi:phycobilisome rod-core linker polypeptide [Synechococcus sp. PCC 7336]|uniref:phycobilisome rod-core linker polypeptide n=1 Tax=Synechococcus sp. PCC 7336 TaxID=195250 RepID=UPI00034BD016|nr:phycobilisome rod-core linker polypeptide [Synechococcus sp. PCC 7336]
MANLVQVSEPVELYPNASEEDLQIAIRAVYRQVLGNPHVLESDRLTSAESLLRNGEITVRGFVGQVAKSALYRSLAFESVPQYRFIELNCKHLLGRPPADRAEISEHVQRYSEQGYEAEIDSYLDSDEYISNFGENIVPYCCSNVSRAGVANVSFSRGFAIERGYASSDRGKSAQLVYALGSNSAVAIKPPSAGRGGAYDNTGKRFRISVSKAGAGPRFKRSNMSCEVAFDQLTQRIQSIHRSGGKIVRVAEVD